MIVPGIVARSTGTTYPAPPLTLDVLVTILTPSTNNVLEVLGSNADYEVDWGDGNGYIQYAGGVSAQNQSPGTIHIRSTNTPESFRFVTNNCDTMQIHKADTLTSIDSMCEQLTGMTVFQMVEMPELLSANRAWINCFGMSEFPVISTTPFDVPPAFPKTIDFTQAWENCNSITDFYISDMPEGTLYANAWLSCASLVTMPTNFTLPKGEELNTAFRYCAFVTVENWAFPAAINCVSMFANCTSLTLCDNVVMSPTGGAQFMFSQCSVITCVTYLDTSQAASSGALFDNAPNIVTPDAGTISELNNAPPGFFWSGACT